MSRPVAYWVHRSDALLCPECRDRLGHTGIPHGREDIGPDDRCDECHRLLLVREEARR